MKPKSPIPLTVKDLQILEDIGNKAFYKTKKRLVITDRKKHLSQIKQQWEKKQTE